MSDSQCVVSAQFQAVTDILTILLSIDHQMFYGVLAPDSSIQILLMKYFLGLEQGTPDDRSSLLARPGHRLRNNYSEYCLGSYSWSRF